MGMVLQPVKIIVREIRHTTEVVSYCCDPARANLSANRATKYSFCPYCGLPITSLDPITRTIDVDA